MAAPALVDIFSQNFSSMEELRILRVDILQILLPCSSLFLWSDFHLQNFWSFTRSNFLVTFVKYLRNYVKGFRDDNFALGLYRPSLLANFFTCKLQRIYLQMRRILICTAQPENILYKQTPWNEILALFVNLATNQSCLISNQLAYRLCPLWGISIISTAIEPFISYCICKKIIGRKK